MLLVIFVVSSAPITPKQARTAALNFMSRTVPTITKSSSCQLAYAKAGLSEGDTLFYVFNVGGGFAIVAADDAVKPILGYSPDGHFDPQNIPDNCRAWLQGYADQIAYVRTQELVRAASVEAEWNALLSTEEPSPASTPKSGSSVAPLLTTKWDQGTYYNSLCPEDANHYSGHVWAGCVATAMAQIINYWEYPAHGYGTHSYHHNSYGQQSADFANTTYQYSLMPDSLDWNTPANQVNAVATLMHDCGVAVNMDYGANESGSNGFAARAAFINHFGYNAQMAVKSYAHSEDSGGMIWESVAVIEDSTWIRMLKEELDAGRPIYYSGERYLHGYSGNTGHAFVCDGYDADSLFHFNWGWSGAYNGYFVVGCLTSDDYYPGDMFTPSSGLSFNNNHQAIFVRPGNGITDTLILNMKGRTTATVDGSVLVGDIWAFSGYDFGPNYSNTLRDTLTLTAMTPDAKLFVEANVEPHIPGSSSQGADVFDGASVSGTPMMTFTTLSVNDPVEPVISSTGVITIVYNGRPLKEGFDLHVSEVTCLPILKDFSCISKDFQSATLSWEMYQQNQYASHSFNWQIEYGPQGFAPGTGTIVQPTGTVYQFTGLNADTYYEAYLTYTCVNGSTVTVNPITFNTLPLSECYDPIGNGTSTQSTLLSSAYSWIQQIYTAEELSAAGLSAGKEISILWLQYTGDELPSRQLSVFMKNTDKTEFDNGYDWISMNSMTNVYPETATTFISTYPGNWFPIVFSNPFVWDGHSNIVIAYVNNSGVKNNATRYFYSNYNNYYHRTLYYVSNSDPITGTPSGNQSYYRPNIKLCSPVSCMTPTGLTTTILSRHQVRLDWNRIYLENTWNVEYGPAGFVQGTGTTVTVNNNPSITFSQLSMGVYDFYLQSDCGNGETSDWVKVSVAMGDYDCAQIGTGTSSTSQFPVGYSSSNKYSYVQQLFTAAELSAQGLAAGDNIVSLSFPYSGTPQTKSSVSVWLGHTSKTDMYDNNWIPQSDMQKVYNGSVLLTEDWTTIQFADPFVWDGISSVVVAFLNNSGIDNGSFLSHQHYSWQKTLYKFSSSPVNIDNPGNPTINNYRNNIRFCKSNACVLRRDIEVALLEGDTFNFYGNMISEQGVYGHRWYVNPECDSLVVLHISVRNIIFVTTTGAGSHDGSSWANAMELQEAMNAAATNTNKTTYLYVKKGTYLGNTSSSNSYVIKANVRAYGGFNGNEPATYDLNNRSQENMDQTILFGSNARRVLYQSADFTKARATVFDGFTIRGGTVNTVEEGGAAYIRKFCTLQNCKITANNATISGSESNVTRSGVAVYNNGGTLNNCEIYNNTVTLSGSGSGYQVYGVAVYSSYGIIDGCNIHHNTAVFDGAGDNWNVYGGGIYDYRNSEIRNTSVTSNSASQGGGIYNYGYYSNYNDSSEVRVTNCLISNNTSRAAGGGVYSGAYNNGFREYMKAAFTQCVFGNNAAGGEGGGVYNNCPKISFTACDIVHNSAINGGGGVYTTVDCPLSNCIVWGNKVGASDNQLATANNKYFTMESSAVQGGYSGAITLESENTGAGIGYPNFTNPTAEAGVDANNAIGDWTLQEGSVCINMGNNSFVENIAADLGGDVRIQQGCADIGAYESGHDVAFPLHPQQESNILYVTTTGAGLQDGSSWANATPNLQYAMDMATRYEPTATVWVAQGTYSAGKTFIAQPNVAMYGGFEGIEPYTYDLNQRDFTANTTILDGDSAYCVLNMSCPFAAADSSLFDGFSFTNGYSITNTSNNNISSASAAFLLANIEMRNCIFKNSLFSNTGNGYQPNVAVYAKECIFDNCTFSDNDGYGLYGIGVTVRNCIAEHNNHYGIRARGNSLVENCVLQYNRSGLSIGGGKAVGCTIQENGIGFGYIFNDNYSVSSSDAQIINSNIINNRTNGLSASGGLYENLNISNNSVVRTSVYTYFGGVRAQNHARFINCNIVNNFVSRGSYSSFDEIYGGVYNYTSDNEYTNCIIWGNRLDNNYSDNISGESTFSYCAVEGGVNGIANINLATNNNGADNTASYVRFVNPTATAGVTTQDSVDYRLDDGSACINMGNPNTTSLNLPTYDLGGSLRIKQQRIDIGAFEYGDINLITLNDTICLGESFFYNDYFVYPETPGMFRDTLIYNQDGMDYIANLNLMVNETYNITVEETICEGDTFYFNGQPRTTTGFYTAYLQSSFGCDSTVTLHLIVNPILHNNFSQSACDSFTWNQTTYYTTGDYTQTFEAVTGCDSIVTMHLTVNPSTASDDYLTLCRNTLPYNYHGLLIPTTVPEYDTVLVTLSTVYNCDSVVTLHLHIVDVIATEFSETACDSYTWNDITYTTGGDKVQTFTSAAGCDSVVTLHLTIHPSFSEVVNISACDSYSWNDSIYSTSGDYTQSFTTVHGCDSIVTIHLTVNPSVTEQVETAVCDSLAWNDSIYFESGVYTQTLLTANGCDSTVTMNLTVNHSVSELVEVSICENELPYHYVNGQIDTLFEQGTPALSIINYQLSTQNGCDSTIVLHVTVVPAFTPEITVTGTLSPCVTSSATLTVNGSYSGYLWSNDETTAIITVTTPGSYWVTATDTNGCQGMSEPVQLGLSELITETPSICMVGVENNHNLVVWEELSDPDVASYQIYRENNQANVFESLAVVPAGGSNAYEDVTADPSVRAWRYKITASDSCGGETPMSAYHKTVHLTINQGIGNSWNLIWTPYEGFEYSSYNIYRGTANNNLQLIQTMPATLTSFTDNNPGSDVLFYQIEAVMAESCVQHTRDVTHTGVRSNIAYNGVAVYAEESVTACESYDWNGQVLTENGNYVQTLVSELGYDSVVTLHLTLLHPENMSFVREACGSYTPTWADGYSQTYTESGVYTHSYEDANGCTETDTLYLTITEPPVVDFGGSIHIQQGETAHIYDHLGGNPNWFYVWNNGMEGSSIEVSPSVTTTYTVVVYTDGTFSCYTTATVTVVVTTGVSDYEVEELTLYPNPTSGKVFIDHENVLSVEVLDKTGRLLAIQRNDNEVDLSAFADGVYTLRIELPEGVVLRKVIKTR